MRSQRKPIFQPVKPAPGAVTFNHKGVLVYVADGKPVKAEAA